MSSPLIEIRHSPARAAKQLVVMVLVALIGVAFVVFSAIYLLSSGDVVAIVIGAIVGLLGLLTALICGYVAWLNLSTVLGRDAPALVVDEAGIRWQQGISITWEQVTAMRATTESSISLAGGADKALDRAAERAMAAGGVNDGDRELTVFVRDRAALAATAGDYAGLVSAGDQPGSGKVDMILGPITDGPTFADAVRKLEPMARQRGIAWQFDQRA
ncbi:hypothetical protein ACQBAR_12375 [Propionibacteriaceae bacterium Y1685]